MEAMKKRVYGIYMYAEFAEDVSGCLNSDGEKTELKWDGKAINFADGLASEKSEYFYNEGVITITSDNKSMVLQKLNDEELAQYEQTGGKFDIEALSAKMFGIDSGEIEVGIDGAGTDAGTDMSGTTYKYRILNSMSIK